MVWGCAELNIQHNKVAYCALGDFVGKTDVMINIKDYLRLHFSLNRVVLWYLMIEIGVADSRKVTT